MPNPFFAYLGPETLLPMTSVVATIAGLIMMFGHNTLRLAARCFRSSRRRRERRGLLSGPHFRIRTEEKSQSQAR